VSTKAVWPEFIVIKVIDLLNLPNLIILICLFLKEWRFSNWWRTSRILVTTNPRFFFLNFEIFFFEISFFGIFFFEISFFRNYFFRDVGFSEFQFLEILFFRNFIFRNFIFRNFFSRFSFSRFSFSSFLHHTMLTSFYRPEWALSTLIKWHFQTGAKWRRLVLYEIEERRNLLWAG
jgi:hypothetical protein